MRWRGSRESQRPSASRRSSPLGQKVPAVITCAPMRGPEAARTLFDAPSRHKHSPREQAQTMAVYTDVPDEELKAFIAEYDIGEGVSCKGIAEGIENSNYLLRTDSGTFILTLYEKRVAPADLPFFLSLMEHLAARGIPCPTPIHGRDGAALRRLSGKPAAMVSFLDGMWPRRIQPMHCGALGHALAKLHLAGSDFSPRRANDLSLDGWARLFAACAARADEVKPGLAEELGRESEALRGVWPGELPQGVSLGDLPERLVLRARWQLQRHQGEADARAVPRRPPAQEGGDRSIAGAGARRG